MTDQFSFNEQQELNQPPPEVVAAQKAKLSQPKKHTKKWWFIGGGLLFLLILVLTAWLGRPHPTPKQEIVQTIPTIMPRNSAMEEQISRMRSLVMEADPNGDPFPPPQVDMSVEF